MKKKERFLVQWWQSFLWLQSGALLATSDGKDLVVTKIKFGLVEHGVESHVSMIPSPNLLRSTYRLVADLKLLCEFCIIG